MRYILKYIIKNMEIKETKIGVLIFKDRKFLIFNTNNLIFISINHLTYLTFCKDDTSNIL